MNRTARNLAIAFFGRFFDKKVVRSLCETTEGGIKVLIWATWRQKFLGFNRGMPWPVHHSTVVSDPRRLHFDPSDSSNLRSPGCYFQNFAADIVLGRGCYVAPNVGIITANHDPSDLKVHLPGQSVHIGSNSWIGMNSTVLPGVVLGEGTIVGAGSVVTRSFPAGHCVIAGNPARVIRHLHSEA